jgi:hypothetical protein
MVNDNTMEIYETDQKNNTVTNNNMRFRISLFFYISFSCGFLYVFINHIIIWQNKE